MIYLDYAATTPMSETALHMYEQAAKNYFGNTSSLHDSGTMAAEVLERCRKQMALMINGASEGIYFTSGGSEANMLAIKSLLKGNQDKGNHIITTAMEHASLHNLFLQLESEGYEITYIPVDHDGVISLHALEAAIQPNTVLASIHHGNSEVGIVQPIEQIGAILDSHDVLFHTDCVQTFGELIIDVAAYKIDSLSVSSHKIYGPKACGFAYIAPEVPWTPIFSGTTHEGGFRPGTLDVPGIVAFTAAAQNIWQNREDRIAEYKRLRALFLKEIASYHDKIIVEASTRGQLPQIIGLSFSQVQGQHIMLACNQQDIHISTGSACQVGMQSPSRTMLALGKTADEAKQFVRISLGKETTSREILQVTKVLKEIVDDIN